MGGKPSNAMQSNRPESGGADYKEQQEKSGLLDREKQELAQSEREKHEARSREDQADGLSDDNSSGPGE